MLLLTFAVTAGALAGLRDTGRAFVGAAGLHVAVAISARPFLRVARVYRLSEGASGVPVQIASRSQRSGWPCWPRRS